MLAVIVKGFCDLQLIVKTIYLKKKQQLNSTLLIESNILSAQY